MLPHNFLLLLYLWVPMTLLRANCFLWLCHTQSKEEITFLSAALSSIWNICFPGCREGSGVHRPPSAGASKSGPSLQDPIPSFWQLPGMGESKPGLGDLAAVSSAPWDPVSLSLSGAHSGCRAEGPLSFNTRGSHCLACASIGKGFSTKGPCVSCIRDCLFVSSGV